MPIKTELQTARQITLANAIDSFIQTELLACSAQTVTWYQSRLRLFVAAMGPDIYLGDLTERDLIVWWKSLQDRTHAKPPTLSIETMHGYVRAVRRVFKWLFKENLLLTELHLILKLPKIPEQNKKGVEDYFVVKILEASKEKPRDYAIITFLESTGCRRGGVATLRLSDLNLSEPEPFCRRVSVHEKGDRVRNVIMSPVALEAMRAWLAVRKSATDFVFVDTRRGKEDGLLPGGVSEIILRYQHKLGIKGRCSPHQWRHRFCRARLKEGAPLNVVSQMAGHQSILVTAKYYSGFTDDELLDAYDRYYKPPKS